MKKLLISLATLVTAVLTITGCSPKVEYLEEFSYLPEVTGMGMDQFEEAEGDGYANAIYIIQDEDYEDFLEEYEELLVKDGWEIEKDEKPEHIEATKGDHIARINVVDSNEELMILIWSK